MSNNAKQRFKDSVSKQDGRGKAAFRGLAGRQAPEGPAVRPLETEKKKVMSKRGKTSAGLNPSQLCPQQNLLLYRRPRGFQSLMP